MSGERLFVRTRSRQLIWPPPDRNSSLFREADPGLGLAAHVAKIRWGHEWIPPEAPVQERIVPDGAIHLLFVFSNREAGGRYGLAVGASSAPTVVRLAGNIEHVEIELRAGAVPALLGIPAGELAGQAVALADLWRDRAAVVSDRLQESRGEGRIAVLEETLRGVLGQSTRETPPAVGEALRRITSAGGNLRVGPLAAGLGLSDRRLEQLFHWHVGLSPKAACRLARLRASVELLVGSHAHPRWAEMALERGFSDQSHLANEFRALTGLAPGEFHRRAGFGFLQDPPAGRRYPRGK